MMPSDIKVTKSQQKGEYCGAIQLKYCQEWPLSVSLSDPENRPLGVAPECKP